MGSALLDPPPEPAPHAAGVLRTQAAQRLAAHRATYGRQRLAAESQPAAASPSLPNRTSRIASAVAERYANSPSYRAVLAAHAERAMQEAQAAAEIAAINAQAIAQAQQLLLADLQEEAKAASSRDQAATLRSASAELHHIPALQSKAVPAGSSASVDPAPVLTVRLFETCTPASLSHASAPLRPNPARHLSDDPEALALDEEIAFRHAPVFEESAEPPMPLAANLIEFPRQLVAPRKVRPRYAEGPLREEAAPAGSQLRIFEVEAAHISATPSAEEPASHRWTSLWLDVPASTDSALPSDLSLAPGEEIRPNPRPHTAAVSRRLFAAALDACLILAGFAAFAASFLFVAFHGHMPALHDVLNLLPQTSVADQAGMQSAAHVGGQADLALATVAASLAFLYLVYHALFFSFAESTPGMRCARIALCTFADDNPTRPAMRRRIFATLVSALPLGLGLLWAFLDEDRLAWHDRITRTYQRSY